MAARPGHARLRPGADPGDRRLDPGEPARSALRRGRRRRARARLGAAARRHPLARARPGRAAPRRLRRVGRPLTRLEPGRAPGRDRAARLLPPLRPAGRGARSPRLAPPLGGRALRRADPDGDRLCGDRDRAVDQPRHLLEPEAARRQHLRALLPRQLRLLGPVDLRALPGRVHPGEPDRRALLALCPGRAPGCGRDCRRLDGTDLLVLAVELPGPDRRRGPGRGARVGPARAAPRLPRRGGVRARRRGGAERAPRRPAPRERRAQPGDERPLEADQERLQDRRAPSRGRRRDRRLQARLRETGPPAVEGAGGRRLARHADHGDRRERPAGPAAARLARVREPRARLSPARLRPAVPDRAHLRARLRRDRRSQPLLQRFLRGPDRLGRSRPRDGRRAATA